MKVLHLYKNCKTFFNAPQKTFPIKKTPQIHFLNPMKRLWSGVFSRNKESTEEKREKKKKKERQEEDIHDVHDEHVSPPPPPPLISPSASSCTMLVTGRSSSSSSSNNQKWTFVRQWLRAGGGKCCWLDICDRLPPDMCVNPILFKELWNLHPVKKGQVRIYGKLLETPRWQQAFGESYHFSGMTHVAAPLTHPFLKHLAQRVFDHSGFPYLQVLINWYQDGNHRIGWHSDDESQLADPRLDPRIVIYSFSFGQTRRFDLRENGGVKEIEIQRYLTNNSCINMGGQTQRYYKHQVPTEKKCLAPRINVTFRLFRKTYEAFVAGLTRELLAAFANQSCLFFCSSSSSSLFGIIRSYL